EVLGEALPELVAGLGVVGVDGPDVRLPLGGVPVQVLLGVGEGEYLPARVALQTARADLVAVAGQPGLRRHGREVITEPGARATPSPSRTRAAPGCPGRRFRPAGRRAEAR